MTSKIKAHRSRCKGVLTSFYANTTTEQKRSVYLIALEQAKTEQSAVSERARKIRAMG